MSTENTTQEAIDLAVEPPQQVAKILNVSVDTVIRWFRDEPGPTAQRYWPQQNPAYSEECVAALA